MLLLTLILWFVLLLMLMLMLIQSNMLRCGLVRHTHSKMLYTCWKLPHTGPFHNMSSAQCVVRVYVFALVLTLKLMPCHARAFCTSLIFTTCVCV